MEAHVRTRFQPRKPLDLALTLGPIGRGAWLHLDANEAWRGSLTPEGPSTLHLVHVHGTVEVEAWGPGAEWAAAQAPVLCGEHDDDTGFQPSHPLLSEVRRRNVGLRMPRTQAVFEAIVPAILGQKVTGVESHRAYRALVAELGERAPGPMDMKIPPSSEVLARTPYWIFHRFGVERRRAEFIIRAARSARRLAEVLEMDMASAYCRLQAFPGVGPWTAAHVALVALGDADAVPVGDYNLAHTVGYALEGTPRSTDERMLELLEPYRGHRARVLRLIAVAGISAPRFGPRMPLRDFARD